MGNSCCAIKPVPIKTSSLCTTEVATGTHKFVVMNYLRLDGMGAGEFVTSSTFCVGGHEWCISFYPDGDGREPGYAGAFLSLRGDVAPEAGVRVYFTLSLRERGGSAHRGSTPLYATHTFKSGETGVGNIKLVHKSYLQRDCFTIRCDLVVVLNTNVQMMLPN